MDSHGFFETDVSIIGWPQQPPTEKVINFNRIIHDSKFSQNCVSKYQNKAEYKDLDDSEVLSSNFPDHRTLPANVTSTVSTTFEASVTFTAAFLYNIHIHKNIFY